MSYTGVNAPILVLLAPPPGALTLAPAPSLMQATHDLSDLGGRGRIAGTVMVDGTPDYPAWRRVRLFDRRDNRLVGETWSDPATGEYAFQNINSSRTYVVIAYDHTGVYNAEIRDNITPELMP